MNKQSVPLRAQAMAALQESTTMLQVACDLMEQGNKKEAERLHKAARTKRNVSVLLMAKANALELESGRKTHPHYYETDGNTTAPSITTSRTSLACAV